MLRLNRYLLVLVIWLSFFFNIERLDLGVTEPDLFNIASPIYVAVVAVVALGLLIPQVKRIPMWQMQLVSVLPFIAAHLISDRPTWGGAYTYISLFELTSVLISATIAYVIGSLSVEFVEAVRSLMLSDMEGRVYRKEQAESSIKREMQFARRANRPLSIMVIDVDAKAVPLAMQAAEKEVQQILVKRHRLVAVTRLLARNLRRTDFVVDQTDEGRIVLIMPEMEKTQTISTLTRMDQRVQERLGFSLRFGVASFPDQGVTFEELAHQAESDLKPVLHERRGEDTSDAGSSTEKLAVVEVPSVMQVVRTTERVR